MYKYRQNLMNSSTYTCSGYCYQQALQNESGRSMVEMLGVLAIIGVLSVMGIAGYTTAMNSYRANELINGASMRAMVGMSQMMLGTAASNVSFGGFQNNLGYGTFATSAVAVPGSSSKFGVQVSNVDKAVCQRLVNSTNSQFTVAKASTPDTTMTEADCSDNKEQNVLAFIYESGMGNSTPSQPDDNGGNSGSGSNPCPELGECYHNGICVSSGNSFCSGNDLYECLASYARLEESNSSSCIPSPSHSCPSLGSGCSGSNFCTGSCMYECSGNEWVGTYCSSGCSSGYCQ